MASIYKKRPTSKTWTIAYFDASGKRVVVPGTADKKATEALARKLQTETFYRRRGMYDERTERAAAQKVVPIDQHVNDFESHLRDNGDCDSHVNKTVRRVRQILDGIKAVQWPQITLGAVQGWLADRQRADKAPKETGERKRDRRFGASTRNHYTRAIKAFCRWMVTDGRAQFDPLMALKTINADVDVRVKRRVLTAAELAKLLAKTAIRPVLYGLTGPERALVYRLALATGLRANEIRQLRVDDFNLDRAAPVVQVRASISKNAKRDELPLRRDLATDLQAYLKGRQPADGAFAGMPDSDRTAEMFKADLKAAGIDYGPTDARYDFHALRHQFVTDLVTSGVNVKMAQALARHSTPVLTIALYSHVHVHDRQAAVEGLPNVTAKAPGKRQGKTAG